MGFKDFCNNKNCFDKEQSENNQINVEQIYNKYKNKNQQQLLDELFKNVEEQKQNGSFDYNGLTNMLEKMSPFLNQEQKQNLETLLNKIK